MNVTGEQVLSTLKQPSVYSLSIRLQKPTEKGGFIRYLRSRSILINYLKEEILAMIVGKWLWGLDDMIQVCIHEFEYQVYICETCST